MPGSNAERIGLKPLDILVRVNDESVPTSVDVSEALGELKTGSHIELLVARDLHDLVRQRQDVLRLPKERIARRLDAMERQARLEFTQPEWRIAAQNVHVVAA